MAHAQPQARAQSQLRSPNTMNDAARCLIGLLKMLVTPTVTSIDLINYLKHNRIDPNTYLPTINGQAQLPLVYYCCSNSALTDFLLYLMGQRVNLNAPMISDQPIELLYYSQIQYIPLLVEHGCTLNPQMIPTSVEKLLIKGNISKLIALHKSGAIKKDQLLPLLQTPGLIFRILDQLYEKIYYLSQQVGDEQKFLEIYSEIMKNYVNTFKFCLKNGTNVNQIEDGESFVQRAFNTYFFPLIELVMGHQPNLDSEEFLHYSNFDLSNRQVMKFIYNQHNYHQIENYLTDKITPKKINIKKNITRKIIHLN
jgi:hypothetical protein